LHVAELASLDTETASQVIYSASSVAEKIVRPMQSLCKINSVIKGYKLNIVQNKIL
jgi:hypothetical protein